MRFARVSFSGEPSRGRVSHIVEDKRGFLWFATHAGLRRYDGYRFREYRHDPRKPGGLSGDYITALFLDRSGTIWVGSTRSLDRYEPASDAFTRCRPDQLQAMVWQVNQDREGSLWIATEEGLFRLDPQTWQITRYQHSSGDPTSLSNTRVTATLEDQAGNFWVGTFSGLDVFDRRTGKVTQHVPLPAGPIRMLEDHAGVLWVLSAFGNGLSRLDRRERRLLHYVLKEAGGPGSSPILVRTLFEDTEGALWLGTLSNGLLRLDRNRRSWTQYRKDISDPESLSADRVDAICEDREGSIWIGTTGGGINRFARKPLPFRRYQRDPRNADSLPSDFVSTAYEDSRGTLWLGSRDALTAIDRKTGQYRFYREAGGPGQLSSTFVISVAEDRSGDLWFGTLQSGLNRLDQRTGRFQVYRHDPADPHSLSSNSVNRLYVDRRGRLWAATEDGLNLFEPQSGGFRVYRLAGEIQSAYRTITEDRDGTLWLATLGYGIRSFNPGSGEFRVYHNSPTAASISSDVVNTLYADRAGIVWVGTVSGLDRLDPATGAVTSFSEEDGLPNGNISGILQDDRGNLWLSTNYGLSRFDPRAKTFRNYYTSDGIHSNEFYGAYSASKGRNGEMFFCSYNGMTSFFPEQVIDNPNAPPVVLTDFLLEGKPAPIGGDSPLKQSISDTRWLTLTHLQNIFSIEFSALSYINPARSRYRYMLEGLDGKWTEVDSSRRWATYTTLAPGDYVFRVQGRTSRTSWNEGASLRIRILPPWWNTLAFRTAVGLAVAMLLAFAYRWRVHSMARRNRELADQVEDRTRQLKEAKDEAEAANRAKSEFLASVSHDLRTPLNGVLGYAQLLKRAGGLSEKQMASLDTIQRSGEHLLTLITDLLDLAKIEAGKLEANPTNVHLPSFLAGIGALIRIRAEQKGLLFTLERPATLPEGVRGDEHRLRQVLLNLLDNAVKFTDRGRVSLRVSLAGGDAAIPASGSPRTVRLRFEVEDTGIGLTPQQLEAIFQPFVQVGDIRRRAAGVGLGLAISRKLVELMGGSIQVRSEAGQGSLFAFELALPLTEAAARPAAEAQTAIAYRGPRKKALVVDDVPENRATLTEFLGSLGFEVAEAGDGEAAVRRAGELRPDLILMDIRMPLLDGLEATRRLRQIPELRETRIIAVSAGVSQSDASQCVASGADAFVPKPIELDRLAEQMGVLLGIAWTYQPRAEGATAAGHAALVAPPAEELAVLHELARLGNMRKIRERAAQVATLDDSYRPLADRLCELARGCQSQAILSLLQHLMEGESVHGRGGNR